MKVVPAGMNQNRHIRRYFAAERSRARLLRLPLSHWPIVCLALVAVLIQSFVVQTHIHIPQGAGRQTSLSVVTLAGAFVAGPGTRAADNQAAIPRDKYPINEDPSNCPLCQEIAHSGQFVQSAAVLAYVPVWVSVHFINFCEVLPSLFTVSHSWRGRAPPQA